jgi:hypothetical protein
MAKSPNTTPINGISYSWTQPYLPTNYNPFYQPSDEHKVTEEQKKRKEQEIELANEIAWLDYVESEFIQDMLTYPDAEAIINKIMNKEDPSV